MTILESKCLCRYFGGLKAVDQIDMKVEEGEIFGIIGPNGAGKTTFFNVCSGTYTASSGNIFFYGKDITNKKPEDIAKLGIARTFQNLKLFSYMTVEENIAVGFHVKTKSNILDAIFHTPRFKNEEQYIREQTAAILERLGLSDMRQELASKLSYGTQRKVEIARAMALQPKILLLDEPAAGMNPLETQSLMEFVKLLNKQGYTIVVIEHDMKFMMNLCDRILVMNYGRKICEGLPEDIRNNEEVQEAYLGKGLDLAAGKEGLDA